MGTQTAASSLAESSTAAILALSWALTAGCSSPVPTPSASASAAPSAAQPSQQPSPAATAKPPAAKAPVAKCSLAQGTSTAAIMVDGKERRYRMRVGPGVDGPAPVLFAWHGWGSRPSRMMRLLDVKTLWHDAIVIAPYGQPRSFESLGAQVHDGWQIAPGEFDDRDLKLFDTLLGTVTAAGCVDADRVYSSGFSNGGFFSNLLGCRRGEVLAAVAPAGGGGPHKNDGCTAQVPVMITHGRADNVVPFDFGARSFAAWTARNECAAGTQLPREGCVEANACTRAVKLCSFEGGHRWPKGTAERVASFLKAQARAK